MFHLLKTNTRRTLFGLLLTLLVLMSSQNLHAQSSSARDSRSSQELIKEMNQVDTYLARLGLIDQQILLFEDYLERGLSSKDKDDLAQKASELYADRLMRLGDDLSKAQKYIDRVDLLIRRYPKADTPSLKVMLLQADYNMAETLITKWINDSSDEKSFTSALQTLEHITPQLIKSHAELTKQVELLYEVLDRMPDGKTRETRLKKTKQLEAVASRAAYFAAWSNYYLQLTKPSLKGNTAAKQSIDLFKGLLGFNKEINYSEIEGASLGLDLDWRARSFIGLGLSESLLGNINASYRCFELLKSSNASPAIIDQANYWYIQGLLNAAEYAEAREFAQQIIGNYQGNSTEGKTSFCVTITQHGFRPPQGRQSIELPILGNLGIVGLAKLGHHSASIQLLEKYGVPLNQNSGFYMQWLQGQQAFTKAEESKEENDYKQAQSILTAALDSPESENDLSSSSECRYTLAWCSYRLKDLPKAGTLFRDAVSGLKVGNESKAAESAWMSFVAFQTLAKEQPRYASNAIDVLESIKRDFPTHPYAKKADFYIAKLQQTRGSLSSSIKQLMEISASDPNYLSARYDLCVLLRQQIDKSTSEAEKKKIAEDLKTAVDQFHQGAGSKLETSVKHQAQVSKCLLMVVDVANKKLLDASLAKTYVEKAAPIVGRLPDGQNSIAEYHYRALLVARAASDQASTLQHADWLVAHAQGSSYEMTGLIIKALELDQQTGAGSNPSQAVLEEGYEIYKRLVTHLGVTPSALKKSKNAKVSCSKLANFATLTGKHAAAAQYLAALLQAYPADRDYLQRAGRSEFITKNYTNSLNRWRILLVGLPKNSPEWFEAKYYQLVCLLEYDPKTGKKVMKQFNLLHSDGGKAPWRDKMIELNQRYSSS